MKNFKTDLKYFTQGYISCLDFVAPCNFDKISKPVAV